MGWPQQESPPSPALVTIISVPHFVHWYRLPTWFATLHFLESYVWDCSLANKLGRRQGGETVKDTRMPDV